MKSFLKNYSLLILAGGKSRRIGRNKAQLLFEGRSFLDTLIDKGLAVGFKEIFVSGYQCHRAGATWVADVLGARGPLGGLHAGFRAAKNPHCLVLAVDVPQIYTATMKKLVQAHSAGSNRVTLLHHGQRTEPLLGVYDTDTTDEIESMVKSGAAPVFRALDKTGFGIHELEEPEFSVLNINTLEDYRELLHCIEKKRGIAL